MKGKPNMETKKAEKKSKPHVARALNAKKVMGKEVSPNEPKVRKPRRDRNAPPTLSDFYGKKLKSIHHDPSAQRLTLEFKDKSNLVVEIPHDDIDGYKNYFEVSSLQTRTVTQQVKEKLA